MDKEFVLNLAKKVNALGGRAYIVGGWTRDLVMLKQEPGKPLPFVPFDDVPDAKDIDIEVYGVSQADLEVILAKLGKVDLVGKSFGVYKHGEFDISLPRTETKSGTGHKGFDIVPDPSLPPEQAVLRRDLTINAILYDPLTGTFMDPTGGMFDIETGTLRYVDRNTFGEDPLRVYRVMQFIGRFGFSPTTDLVRLCTEMVASGELDTLPRERVYEEFNKLLLRGVHPSLGLEFLLKIGAVEKYFPELYALRGSPQHPDWHREGDVWNHTMLVIDSAVRERDNSSSPAALMYAALCHDLGKPSTTRVEDGKLVSKGHDEAGEPPTRRFMERLTNDVKLIEEVAFMVRHHLVIDCWAVDKKVRKSAGARFFRKMEAAGVTCSDIMALTTADNEGRVIGEEQTKDFDARMENVRWFGEFMASLTVTAIDTRVLPKPLVTGNDLIALGLKPGPAFKELLDKGFNFQMDNPDADKAAVLEVVKRSREFCASPANSPDNPTKEGEQ